jgi:hypothetical protein
VSSVLKDWRRSKQEAEYFAKAQRRSQNMSEAEVMAHVDLALLTAGQAVSRYRNFASDRLFQTDQLRELKINLEAALGMLENVLPD